MGSSSREQALSRAFVELADTLVGDFDVADLLQGLVEHCVSLLDADAAGLLLSDQRGHLQLMASSSEASRLLELFQLQSDEGPCLDCFHTGRQVAVADLGAVSSRWPRFAVAAREQGYGAVHATPLRLREEVIGALNLFNAEPRALSADDLDVVQALADVATIAILQERATHHGEVVVEQLQGALNARVIIEQAKGLLAGASNLDMEQAFWRLRYAARSTNSRLADVALDLVEGRLDPSSIIAAPPSESTKLTAQDDRTKPQHV